MSIILGASLNELDFIKGSLLERSFDTVLIIMQIEG